MKRSSLRIELTSDPSPETTELILQRLIEFNRHYTGASDFEKLSVFLRDPEDQIMGGLVGSTYYQWLQIDLLWIHESCRGEHYGSTLLTTAEQEAIKRGCHSAYLDTFSFQAPQFYQKHGYAIYGELPDFPTGQTRFFLKKALRGT